MDFTVHFSAIEKLVPDFFPMPRKVRVWEGRSHIPKETDWAGVGTPSPL